LARALGDGARRPLASLGGVVAALVCLVSAWGFLDFIAVDAFGAAVDTIGHRVGDIADASAASRSDCAQVLRRIEVVDGSVLDTRASVKRAHEAIAHALEGAMRCGDDAVQLHGGAGFMRDYPVEKLMRDAKQIGLTCPTVTTLDQLSAALSLGMLLDPALVLPTPDLQPIFT
jgi:hypothetical protein